MADEESRSNWDHITGECFSGTLAGNILETWPISMTTVKAANATDPQLQIYQSSYRSWGKWFMQLMSGNYINGRGFLPPGFRSTMHAKIDPRLPKLKNGLGSSLAIWLGFIQWTAFRKVEPSKIHLPAGNLWSKGTMPMAFPFARWADSDDVLMQLLSRWYGFSFTYPGCEIFES